jgi:hypothetical protein
LQVVDELATKTGVPGDPITVARSPSNLQQQCCKLQVGFFFKGKQTALKAARCFLLLLPNCQRTDANNVKYSRGGAQIGRRKCAVCLNALGARPIPFLNSGILTRWVNRLCVLLPFGYPLQQLRPLLG